MRGWTNLLEGVAVISHTTGGAVPRGQAAGTGSQPWPCRRPRARCGMHRDLELFLEAVCKAPEDDDLRGVVADWLEDNAQEDELLAVAAVIRRELAPATSATGPAQEGELPLTVRAMRGWTKLLGGVAGGPPPQPRLP